MQEWDGSCRSGVVSCWGGVGYVGWGVSYRGGWAVNNFTE